MHDDCGLFLQHAEIWEAVHKRSHLCLGASLGNPLSVESLSRFPNDLHARQEVLHLKTCREYDNIKRVILAAVADNSRRSYLSDTLTAFQNCLGHSQPEDPYNLSICTALGESMFRHLQCTSVPVDTACFGWHDVFERSLNDVNHADMERGAHCRDAVAFASWIAFWWKL